MACGGGDPGLAWIVVSCRADACSQIAENGKECLYIQRHELPGQADRGWHQFAPFHPYPLARPCSAGIQSRQAVLCWQAGMLGAALRWLAAASDTRRIDVLLRPLAEALSPATLPAPGAVQTDTPGSSAAGTAGAAGAQQRQKQESLLDALQPALDGAPPGAPNLALLRVHRLLHCGAAQQAGSGSADGGRPACIAGEQQEGGASVGEAVAELRRLPPGLRDACLPLVCAALGALLPGALQEADALQLLAWLQVRLVFFQQGGRAWVCAWELELQAQGSRVLRDRMTRHVLCSGLHVQRTTMHVQNTTQPSQPPTSCPSPHTSRAPRRGCSQQ